MNYSKGTVLITAGRAGSRMPSFRLPNGQTVSRPVYSIKLYKVVEGRGGKLRLKLLNLIGDTYWSLRKTEKLARAYADRENLPFVSEVSEQTDVPQPPAPPAPDLVPRTFNPLWGVAS